MSTATEQVSPASTDPGVAADLGAAALSAAELTAVVASALRHRVRLGRWTVDRLPTSAGAIATEAVFRVQGAATVLSADCVCDGLQSGRKVQWAVVVKVLRSARHWPGVGVIPAHMRQPFIDGFRWRVEAEVLASDLPGRLPPGLRMPRVFRIDDIGDDRVALWVEYVEADEAPWTADTYATAARLLGQWAGRFSGDRMVSLVGAEMRSGLADLAAGRLTVGIFPRLADDAVWAQPTLRDAVDADLRSDLLALAARVPALLERLHGLPQALGHGDACQQNLLVPADGSASFVAIDVAWQRPEAIGFDLGQLLMGSAQAGSLPVDDLPQLHDVVLNAYLQGLRIEGCDVDSEIVRFGFDAAMVIRSAFTSLPLLEHFDDQQDVELCARVAERASLTRYLVDIGMALPI